MQLEQHHCLRLKKWRLFEVLFFRKTKPELTLNTSWTPSNSSEACNVVSRWSGGAQTEKTSNWMQAANRKDTHFLHKIVRLKRKKERHFLFNAHCDGWGAAQTFILFKNVWNCLIQSTEGEAMLAALSYFNVCHVQRGVFGCPCVTQRVEQRGRPIKTSDVMLWEVKSLLRPNTHTHKHTEIPIPWNFHCRQLESWLTRFDIGMVSQRKWDTDNFSGNDLNFDSFHASSETRRILHTVLFPTGLPVTDTHTHTHQTMSDQMFSNFARC